MPMARPSTRRDSKPPSLQETQGDSWSRRSPRFEYDFWSGARDLNPGPHGPELGGNPSNRADSCRFQFESPRHPAWLVQTWTNLQPDYNMKYYTDSVS